MLRVVLLFFSVFLVSSCKEVAFIVPDSKANRVVLDDSVIGKSDTNEAENDAFTEWDDRDGDLHKSVLFSLSENDDDDIVFEIDNDTVDRNLVLGDTKRIYLTSEHISDFLRGSYERFLYKTSDGFVDFVSQFNLKSRSVFYPFGGGDVIYPLSVFPDAKNIVLVGLDHPGNPMYVEAELLSMSDKELDSLLRSSFFRTMEMLNNFSARLGVLPAILSQLNLIGVPYVDVASIEKPAAGVLLSFMWNGEKRNVHYYKMNINNNNVAHVFLNWLKDNDLFDAVFLKATSYNIHNKEFSVLRDYIVKNANVIVQDDSGVPVKYLHDQYDIKVYGDYIKPYGNEFKWYIQPELFKMANKEYLEFCFGYGCKKQSAVMIVAEKKQ